MPSRRTNGDTEILDFSVFNIIHPTVNIEWVRFPSRIEVGLMAGVSKEFF